MSIFSAAFKTSIRSQGLEIPSRRIACRQGPDSPKRQKLWALLLCERYFSQRNWPHWTGLVSQSSRKCETICFHFCFPVDRAWLGETQDYTFATSWQTCTWHNAQSGSRPCAPRLLSADTTEKVIQNILWLNLTWSTKHHDNLLIHCSEKGPYFRDWVPIGTFLTFWVPISVFLILQTGSFL